MKKILLILSFIQITFSAGSQNLDSTMSYCFGMENIITQFNDWSRPRIFDFDKDGDQDFAILEFFNDSLAVYINNGSADFTVTPAYKLPTPPSQVDLAVADFDGDSFLDIVTLSTAGELNFFKNISGTAYSLVNTIGNTTFPNINCHFIEAHELNNDGKIDLIGSGQDTITKAFITFTWQKTSTVGFVYSAINPMNIFAGHNAQFNLPTTHFALGDFDADGFTDLVIGSEDLTDTLEIYKNAGTIAAIGFLAPMTYTNPVGGLTECILAKDCNSDGMPDIEISSSGGFSISKNLASALSFSSMFLNTSCIGRQFDVLDLNSDSKTDLISVNSSGDYFIYTGSSSVSTSPSFGYNTFSIYEANRFGFEDFDGNGIPDLLAVGGGDFPAIHVSRNFSFHIENIIVSTNTVICGSAPVIFSVTNTGTYPGVYSWTPGPAAGTLFTATSAGGVSCAFSYTLPPGLGQCTLYTDTIFINSLPTPTGTILINPGTTICQGTSVVLTASVSGTPTYTWSTGSSANSIGIMPSSNSVYSLNMSNGCPGTETISITVNPKPVVNISAPITTICSGDSVLITAGGASTYFWSPMSSTTNTVTVKPATTFTYSVIGTNSFGCSDTNRIIITVNTPPSLSIVPSKTVVCAGDTMKLTVSGATSYTWTTGSNLTTITVAPNIVFNSYTVTGSNGCLSTSNISINVKIPPTVTAVASKLSLCVGDSVTLHALGATSYTWGLPFQTGSTVFYYPTANTTYSVLGLGANGCYNYTTLVISISTGTNVSIIASEPELCIGKPITISAIGATTYTWNDNTNNPSFTVTPPNNQPLSYSVAAIDMNGCKSTASQVFLISDKCHLLIYNGVTPNGDGHNDFFYIGNIEQYPGNSVVIYNRWGQKLAEIHDYNNINNFWSGSDGSKSVPSGTYYYIIDLNNNTGLLKGFIELTKKDFN